MLILFSQILKHPAKHFETGKGYNATVIAVESDTVVELTFMGGY